MNSAHHVPLRGRTYRPLRRPDSGGTSSLADDDDLASPQTGRSLQERAAVSAQEARNNVDAAPDTSPDDALSRPRRRAKEQLPS